MHRLLYSSVSVVLLDEDELQVLLGASRSHNATSGITGLLVHVVSPETAQAAFVQVLEGERDIVEQTYARIEADDLHTDLTVLARETVDRRTFGDWTMSLRETSLDELGTIVDAVGAGRGELSVVIRDRTAMEALIAHHAFA